MARPVYTSAGPCYVKKKIRRSKSERNTKARGKGKDHLIKISPSRCPKEFFFAKARLYLKEGLNSWQKIKTIVGNIHFVSNIIHCQKVIALQIYCKFLWQWQIFACHKWLPGAANMSSVIFFLWRTNLTQSQCKISNAVIHWISVNQSIEIRFPTSSSVQLIQFSWFLNSWWTNHGINFARYFW